MLSRYVPNHHQSLRAVAFARKQPVLNVMQVSKCLLDVTMTTYIGLIGVTGTTVLSAAVSFAFDPGGGLPHPGLTGVDVALNSCVDLLGRNWL